MVCYRYVVHLEQRVVRVYRFLLEDIQARACNLAGLQSLDQCLLVMCRTARAVDEVGSRFHRLEEVGVEHVVRLIVEEDVRRDVVGFPCDLVRRSHHVYAVLLGIPR